MTMAVQKNKHGTGAHPNDTFCKSQLSDPDRECQWIVVVTVHCSLINQAVILIYRVMEVFVGVHFLLAITEPSIAREW